MKKLLSILLCSILLLSGCSEKAPAADITHQIELYERTPGYTVIELDFPFAEMPQILKENGLGKGDLYLRIVMGKYQFTVYANDSTLTEPTYMFFKELSFDAENMEESIDVYYSISDENIRFFVDDEAVAAYIKDITEATVKYTLKNNDILLYGSDTAYNASVSMKEPVENVRTPKEISNIELPEIADMPYTGEPIIPEIRLWLDGAELYEGRDFEVVYENNTEIGTVTIIYTGIENYTGTLTTEFRIVPPNPELTAMRSGDDVHLNWTALEEGEGYELEYAPASKAIDGYELIASLSADKTGYVFSGADFSMPVFFRVRTYKTVNDEKYYSYYGTAMIDSE